MQVEGGQLATVKAEMNIGMQKKSQEVTAGLVNDLMNDTLSGNQARASQGVGTRLDTVA